MLYQQPCICTQSHIYCNGTANCTVGHDCEAFLLLLGQIAFNFVKKTTVPFTCHTECRLNILFVQLQFHAIIRTFSIFQSIFEAHFAVKYVHTYMFRQCDSGWNTLLCHEAFKSGGIEMMDLVNMNRGMFIVLCKKLHEP